MLSASQPIRAGSHGNYYLKLAREDYYLSGGEPLGQWHGRAVKLLNLQPHVERASFGHLLSGFSPDGKTRWVQNTGNRQRQCGWDLTFSAPKSVSVLWSQAGPETRRAIEQAHENAVHAALDHLEGTVGLTRRGKGGKTLEAAALLFATFQHGTSRAQEPQLHTHAVLVNLSFRSDGTTGTVVSRGFFQHKMSAGALYRAELARELVKALGVGIEPQKHGFHIQGVSRSLCDAFSSRRHRIRELMSERGLSSAVDAKAVAIETRQKKAQIPRQQLFEMWRGIGRQHGWSTPQVEQLLERAKEKPTLGQGPVLEHLFQEAQRAAHQQERDRGRGATPDRTHSAARTKPQQRARDERVCQKSLLGFVLREKWAFPYAPWWSPVRDLKLPYVAFKYWPRRKRFGKIHAQIKLPFRTIQLREKMLFPAAPKWSPVHGISLPAIVVFKNRRPPPPQHLKHKKVIQR